MNDKLSIKNRNSWIICCLAYSIGLFSTSIFGFLNPHPSWQQWLFIIISLGLLSIFLALFVPRCWPRGPGIKVWLLAGIIAISAVVYFQIRIPQPGINDISNILKAKNYSSLTVTIEGKVLSQGRLTESQRMQFWFEVKQLKQIRNSKKILGAQTVTGKLYVTVPLTQGTDFYPGHKLGIVGILYAPKSAANPGAFDFKAYLVNHEAFAGLKGLKIIKREEPSWGLWKLRQRITLAQAHWLKNPEGALVSSIVLGKQAVNLPNDIREQFTKAGLSHVLVASGFQISILLGVVIAVTKNLSSRKQKQFIIGLIVLSTYVGLTGVEPSIMRAALMGIGALVALLTDRKIRISGTFLVAGILLLLFQPLWLWDLSFQLSFLATLGLIVTMPALEKRLDWLPPAIATLIATPIAASIWTLPLLIYIFNSVAIYSIPANIITAPLIMIISLGGMLSAVAALIFPLAGSAIAWLLYYPTHLLIETVRVLTILPGNYLAVGKISLDSLMLIYSLFFLVWLSKFWQRRWWYISLFIVTVVVVPIIYKQLTLVQVTVLATSKEPVLIIQDRGAVALINSGDTATVKYTVIPFLNQQGIYQIDCAIALKSTSKQREDWSEVRKNVLIKHFFSNVTEKQEQSQLLMTDLNLSIGSTKIQLISAKPPILQLQIQEQTWLLLAKNQEISWLSLEQLISYFNSPVFLWAGQSLSKDWLAVIKPKVAIATSNFVSEAVQQQLQQQKIKLYLTGHNGAIQWTPTYGFQTTLKRTGQYIF
ncbi:MAG: ComEC/Rec2 family competence protein [Microcystaceae cyanobacterium]